MYVQLYFEMKCMYRLRIFISVSSVTGSIITWSEVWSLTCLPTKSTKSTGQGTNRGKSSYTSVDVHSPIIHSKQEHLGSVCMYVLIHAERERERKTER